MKDAVGAPAPSSDTTNVSGTTPFTTTPAVPEPLGVAESTSRVTPHPAMSPPGRYSY